MSAGQFQWAFGLFDYLTYLPEYALEMYSLFRYSRIVGLDVTLTVVGESDEANQNFAYEAAMARIPFDQVGISPTELKRVRGSKYQLSPTAGMNKVTLNGHWGSVDELGNPVLDRQFWQTLAEANNATPSEPDRPVVGIAVRTVNGNRGIVSINVSVNFHVQFFELEYKRTQNCQAPGSKSLGVKTRAQREPSRTQTEDSGFDEISEKQAPRRR